MTINQSLLNKVVEVGDGLGAQEPPGSQGHGVEAAGSDGAPAHPRHELPARRPRGLSDGREGAGASLLVVRDVGPGALGEVPLLPAVAKKHLLDAHASQRDYHTQAAEQAMMETMLQVV